MSGKVKLWVQSTKDRLDLNQRTGSKWARTKYQCHLSSENGILRSNHSKLLLQYGNFRDTIVGYLKFRLSFAKMPSNNFSL